MTDSVPPVPVQPGRRSLWQRASVVWLVPLAALVIALGVAWNSYASRGPLIRIVFDEAAGVIPRETELRYRDVTVGLVERVQFTPDLDRVIVSVRIDPEIAPFVDEDAAFWVVRPVISTQGISGLETVLSGVFIEGVWDDRPGEMLDLYQGRASEPLLRAGQQGLVFTLRASDGLLTSSVALLYKGVEVGRVGEPRVSEDGLTVEAEAVVYAPYENLVRSNTRFWDASGFSVRLGTAGAQVDFASLASLIIGGIAFDTFGAGGEPAQPGSVFTVYYDESAARDSLLAEPDGLVVTLQAVFEGNASGLSVGSPVEIDGLRIGEVTALSGMVDEARFGDPNLRHQVVLSLRPSRLGLHGNEREALDWLAGRVAEGLRARLATGNLLTGSLKVQLVTVADATPAMLDLQARPYPLIPATDSAIADVATTAQDTLARIDALPIEQLMTSAIGFLDNASMLVGSAETQAIPGDLRAILADIRGLTASPQMQALPQDIAAALDDLGAAARQARAVLAQLDEAGTARQLTDTLAAAQEATDALAAAAEGVPPLIERLTALAERIEALDVETLLTETTGLAGDARRLLADPALQGLPGRLDGLGAEAQATLAEARAAIGDLRAALDSLDAEALAARLDATLASAQTAAASVEQATQGLPAIAERLDSLAARADALPLEAMVEEIRALAASADALLSAPQTQALPGDISAALAEAEALLREAREGGVIANANAALLSLRTAADRLPGLVDRAGLFIDQAGVAVGGLSETSVLVREAQTAIREVSAAAEAVARLARTIERNPNALIFGR
ncbi:Paraquat-inducible protein B [Rubellimicrobium thermophilum DSM 16684]|uniref:Paraquat-inducible protein B n=1 Tax=Rubellimicrobium thermophilum DSM 16684 TaxID=1123069 RepID=S9R3A0_9RHOB|nr:MlaD family protein [Rubellimicrobium thermophilum]EPX86402.1 Paraquat-inducible protein B [Rubellimicrobium thermophilum DSM 16684]